MLKKVITGILVAVIAITATLVIGTATGLIETHKVTKWTSFTTGNTYEYYDGVLVDVYPAWD